MNKTTAFKNESGHVTECGTCKRVKDVCCTDETIDLGNGKFRFVNPVCNDCCPKHSGIKRLTSEQLDSLESRCHIDYNPEWGLRPDSCSEEITISELRALVAMARLGC